MESFYCSATSLSLIHICKSYPEVLTKARAALEQKLSALYGRTIKVWIFADLFDVEDEEWKNAVEGRLGRLKLSLITEPKVAADAAKAFREMGQFEEIDLIHSEAVTKSNPRAEEGSLYEAVRAVEPFADSCLKRYLGRIMKCRTVEELRSVKDEMCIRDRDYSRHAGGDGAAG